MAETTIDDLYEQVRRVAPATIGDVAPTLAPVAPGIRVVALRTPTLPPAAHTNAYLVGPSHGPQLLVDPGSPYPDQQVALEQILDAETDAGRPLALIALTHHHGDHVGGAAELARRRNVGIAAHAATARRLAGRLDVGRVLEPDEVIELGNVAVSCVFTPGHAEGHLCFATDAATIAGDMVAGIGTILIDPSEGDMALYLASLRALLARPQAALLPAHGPAISDGHAKLREYLAHRLMREAKIKAALARQARTVDELVAEVYSDTPRILWPLAARSLRSHLGKLARDGSAEEVGPERWVSRG